MKVAFVKDNTILSLLIRLFIQSKYHHCVAITQCGKYIIEAAPFLGVIKTPIRTLEARYSAIDYGYINCDDKKAFDYLESRIGNKYDWLAVFCLIFKCVAENRKKDHCSELIANATGLFRKERTSRITPEALWMISKPIK